MIDITTDSEPRVIKQRQTMLKEMNIAVIIGEETHDLDIKIRHEEDLHGEDKELINVQVENITIEFGKGEDVGAKIHNCLDGWFGDNFTELTSEDTEDEFADIFSAIWEYLESQYLV